MAIDNASAGIAGAIAAYLQGRMSARTYHQELQEKALKLKMEQEKQAADQRNTEESLKIKLAELQFKYEAANQKTLATQQAAAEAQASLQQYLTSTAMGAGLSKDVNVYDLVSRMKGGAAGRPAVTAQGGLTMAPGAPAQAGSLSLEDRPSVIEGNQPSWQMQEVPRTEQVPMTLEDLKGMPQEQLETLLVKEGLLKIRMTSKGVTTYEGVSDTERAKAGGELAQQQLEQAAKAQALRVAIATEEPTVEKAWAEASISTKREALLDLELQFAPENLALDLEQKYIKGDLSKQQFEAGKLDLAYLTETYDARVEATNLDPRMKEARKRLSLMAYGLSEQGVNLRRKELDEVIRQHNLANEQIVQGRQASAAKAATSDADKRVADVRTLFINRNIDREGIIRLILRRKSEGASTYELNGYAAITGVIKPNPPKAGVAPPILYGNTQYDG